MDSLRKKNPLPRKIIHLPVTSISPENQTKFIAKFNGSHIEVNDPEQAEILYSSGCFGESPIHGKSTLGHYKVDDEIISLDTSGIENLILRPEEAFFLNYSLKCLTVEGFSTEDLYCKLRNDNENFLIRFVAYQYFRAKNWVVRTGVNFGCDFCKFSYLSLRI